jgi:hypothetical protein
MIEDPPIGSSQPLDGSHHSGETLEQRVHRLEDAVAALQDTQVIEERIIDRVVVRLNQEPMANTTHIKGAERRTPRPAANPPAADRAPPAQPVPTLTMQSSWLVLEILSELRAMVRMFFDIRFRVGWGAYLAVLVIAFILVSGWLMPLAGLPIVGAPLDKVVDLLLALFAYKRLHREVTRYREVMARSTPANPHY